MNPIPVLVILGPTAIGKTKLAVNVAARLNGEIISADSRQVYRRMTIGTGKDLDDFNTPSGKIPFHLIDIRDPGYEFNVFEFRNEALKAIESCSSQSRFPVICGGTGLYLSSLLQNYRFSEVPVNPTLRAKMEPLSDSELIQILTGKKHLHNKTDLTDRNRLIRAIEIAEGDKTIKSGKPETLLDPLIFGLDCKREILYNRIDRRLKMRLDDGLIEEVKSLLDSGLTSDQLRFYGLEYRFITDFILGIISREVLETELARAIHKFAKRQLTWFRKMEKEGIVINWLDAENDPDLNARIILEKLGHLTF
ncbi:MAG: tRNA (adenosine(37)-N6)-dimethylallyltransferase MiaA [Bacteroidetes bacterium]|nr:tRNA (adenosine(37)-N6)-dimethylallyltransferase MiaA [Bacteroidota bacterium]